MNFRVFKEGVLKNVSNFRVYVSGAWKPWSAMRVYKDGAWKDVYPPPAPPPPSPPPAPPSPPAPPVVTLSVSCDPIEVSAAGPVNPLTTDNVEATITGGVAPYIQAWECASWSRGAAPVADTPTALDTTFTATGVALNDTVTATFRITVQDSAGSIAVAQVDASFYRVRDFGSPL